MRSKTGGERGRERSEGEQKVEEEKKEGERERETEKVNFSWWMTDADLTD